MNAIERAGNEATVAEATNSKSFHGASTLPNGGYVLVWDTSGGIRAQIFRPDGQAKGAVIRVTQSSNDENRPDVAALADGSFVVTYTSLNSSTNAAINAQRFSADGTAIGEEFTVFYDRGNTSFDPEITALNDGGYVVVFNNFGLDGSYYSYHGRVFEADGTPRSGGFLVNQTTERFQSFGDVAALDDGGFAVTWGSNEVDGSSHAVMLRLYDSDGTPRSNEIQVNQYWQNRQDDPSIAVLNNGKILLTWNSDWQDGNDEGIFARLMNADGSPAGSEFQVNTQTINEQIIPEVTALSDGGFVIVWANFTSADTATIVAQRFDADGNRVGEETRISQGNKDIDVRPQITELADGVVAVSWQDFSRETFTGEVETRILLTPPLGTSGNDDLTGTRFGDHLDGLKGHDELIGFQGDDKLTGGLGQDTLLGMSGADTLMGSRGDDILTGGAGNDRLLGGAGDDTLSGGTGDDMLNGGEGDDVFVFARKNGSDIVKDFDVIGSNDKIDFSDVTRIKHFADLRNNHMSQDGNDVIIKVAGENRITLTDTSLADLGRDDFLF